MTQYIDKAALVAEIQKRFDEYASSILKHYDACKEAKAQELSKILIIINTLEVKEVDLQEKQEFLEKAYDCLKPLLDPDSLMVVQQKLLELVYGMKVIE